MNRFKTKAIFLLSVLLMMLLSACGGGDNTTATTGGKATVTFMTWEGTATNTAIDAAMKKFSDSNITVKRIPSPNSDFGQKITSLTLAKQLPDFFWCGNDTEQDLGAKGVLYDWSSHASKTTADFDTNNFAASALQNWYSPDGKKLYGVPTLMNTYGYFYNADMFNAAKVALPKPGWTFEDYFAATKALTKKNGNTVTQYGAVGGPYADPFAIGDYSVSAGGAPFVNAVIGQSKVTIDPKFVEGTKKFADVVQAGYVTPLNYNGGDTTAAFLAGKVPMLWGGQWLAAGFIASKPNIKYGFAPLPIVQAEVQPYDAVGICSPSYIKNPDAVWKVMTYLNTQGWKDILPGAPVAPAAYVPASSTYFDTLQSNGLTTITDTVKYVLATKNKQAIRFNANWSTKANDVITANWNDILTGKKPLQPTLDNMAKQINDIIQAGS